MCATWRRLIHNICIGKKIIEPKKLAFSYAYIYVHVSSDDFLIKTQK